MLACDPSTGLEEMVLASFVKRDFNIAMSYKIAFLVQIAGIFFAVPLFYFASTAVSGGEPLPVLRQYGGNLFAFVLIGVALVDFSTISLRTFSESLRESQLMGTLEIVLLSPIRLSELLVYSSIWGYLLTSLRFITYIVLGMAFGLQLGNANVPGAVLVLLLAIISFAAIGILVATVTLLIKRGEALNTLISAASVFLGGVIYPVSVLPSWLAILSKALPITYALAAMRMALLEGRPTVDLLSNIGVLLAFAVVLLPVSMFAFWAAVRITKVTGTLGQY